MPPKSKLALTRLGVLYTENEEEARKAHSLIDAETKRIREMTNATCHAFRSQRHQVVTKKLLPFLKAEFPEERQVEIESGCASLRTYGEGSERLSESGPYDIYMAVTAGPQGHGVTKYYISFNTIIIGEGEPELATSDYEDMTVIKQTVGSLSQLPKLFGKVKTSDIHGIVTLFQKISQDIDQDARKAITKREPPADQPTPPK